MDIWPKPALMRMRQAIRKIKTGYEIGYDMNTENHMLRIGLACSDQLRFNV